MQAKQEAQGQQVPTESQTGGEESTPATNLQE
jgi:hypothetical protein